MPEVNQPIARSSTDLRLVGTPQIGVANLPPTGNYVAVLTDGDEFHEADSGIDLGYSILCGEFTNRTIRNCLQTRHPDAAIKKDALRQLAALCCACGAPYPSALADLCNVPFTLSLGTDQTVTGYTSLNQQAVA